MESDGPIKLCATKKNQQQTILIFRTLEMLSASNTMREALCAVLVNLRSQHLNTHGLFMERMSSHFQLVAHSCRSQSVAHTHTQNGCLFRACLRVSSKATSTLVANIHDSDQAQLAAQTLQTQGQVVATSARTAIGKISSHFRRGDNAPSNEPSPSPPRAPVANSSPPRTRPGGKPYVPGFVPGSI